MRRYDDPVEVRRGTWTSDGHNSVGGGGDTAGPEQFLWRGRLWKVRAVLAHWVETGPWWQSADVRAVVGSDEAVPAGAPGPRPHGGATAVPVGGDLLVERELWRVEAGRGGPGTTGVFDLSFSWADGSWQLVGCAD